MKKALSTIALAVVALLAAWLNQRDSEPDAAQQPQSVRPPSTATASTDAARPTQASAVAEAFSARRSNQVLTDNGRVIKVLADDLKGDRHQRFLVQINQGPTILIAHNIDLAPRLQNLREGDQVRFKGEYEWTEKGGVVHWTHHDPGGRHPDGWIERQGERYQ